MRLRTLAICGACAIGGGAVAAYASETIAYTYDARGRLVGVTHNGSVNDNVVSNYTFDDADNRKSLNVMGAPDSS